MRCAGWEEEEAAAEEEGIGRRQKRVRVGRRKRDGKGEGDAWMHAQTLFRTQMHARSI